MAQPGTAKWPIRPEGISTTLVTIIKPSVLEQPAALTLPTEDIAPIRGFLLDGRVTEITINGPHAIYVEVDGKMLLTDRTFDDENHLMRVVDTLATAAGQRIDPQHPLVEARLPDGSRLSIALPPVAVDGPLVAIRKFPAIPYTMDSLIRFGTLSVDAAAFLRACVMARANLLIAGGSSSGKTTLLNVLSAFIEADERIVTVEDAAELRLQQDHVCRLESIPALSYGGVATLRELVAHAVRMRPDRLIVGEVRGAEAFDLLQAMNTGHEGSLSTIHANSPRDALARLETLAMMAGCDLPMRAIRRQLVSAIDVIVHVMRRADGSRRVTRISEVTGMEDETVATQDIFVSELAEAHGSGGTRLLPTGIRPRTLERIIRRGVRVPELQRLFPQERLQSPIEARRPAAANAVDSRTPTADRRRA